MDKGNVVYVHSDIVFIPKMFYPNQMGWHIPAIPQGVILLFVTTQMSLEIFKLKDLFFLASSPPIYTLPLIRESSTGIRGETAEFRIETESQW